MNRRRGAGLGKFSPNQSRVVPVFCSPEMELAEEYNQKADAIENAGYHRLATSFRSISDDYKRDAERIKKRYADRHRPEEK